MRCVFVQWTFVYIIADRSSIVKVFAIGRFYEKTCVVLSVYHHFVSLTVVSASAVVNDTLKVGIRWGDTALEAANLENAVGSGYEFGYYDEDREFVYLDETDKTTITMQASGSGNGVTVTETRSGEVLFQFRLLSRHPPHGTAHGDLVQGL